MSEVHGDRIQVTGDDQAQPFPYDKGGVPWYLLLLYIGFLTFFTWYVLEYQLPDYLQQGPGRAGSAEAGSAEAGSAEAGSAEAGSDGASGERSAPPR